MNIYNGRMSKITTASLAEKSNITEAALYRHFPSKRSIYAELFSFCDDTIFAKCNELKKEKISAQEKVKKIFIFFMLFIEKNKGLIGKEADNRAQELLSLVDIDFGLFENILVKYF